LGFELSTRVSILWSRRFQGFRGELEETLVQGLGGELEETQGLWVLGELDAMDSFYDHGLLDDGPLAQAAQPSHSTLLVLEGAVGCGGITYAAAVGGQVRRCRMLFCNLPSSCACCRVLWPPLPPQVLLISGCTPA